MWMVPPHLLCRKHLLGEHGELHMFTAAIDKGLNLNGFLEKRLFFPALMQARHFALVTEMLKRGYSHNSPLNISNLDYYKELIDLNIDYSLQEDTVRNINELYNRCDECRKRIINNL